MKWSHQKTLDALRQAIDLPLNSIHFGTRTQPPADVRHLALGQPRLVMPLRGVKQIRFASDYGTVIRDFHPGDVLICNSDVWCEECWKNPHSMFSIVLRPDYLRMLTIDFRHLQLSPRDNPDSYFFHTPGMPPPAIYHTFSALLAGGGCQSAACMNVKALLYHCEYFLSHLPDQALEKTDLLWADIRDYLDMNFTHPLDRDSIAGHLRIHPATLSRLVKKNTGCGVIEYLTRLRLNYALVLLQEKHRSIKEIADDCGFSQENYFIRIFRKYFLLTPGQYRKTPMGDSITQAAAASAGVR